MTHDHDSDHDIVVVDRGSSVGLVLGILVIALIVGAIWFFAFGPGQGTFDGTTTPNDINVNVDLPSVAPGAS